VNIVKILFATTVVDGSFCTNAQGVHGSCLSENELNARYEDKNTQHEFDRKGGQVNENQKECVYMKMAIKCSAFASSRFWVACLATGLLGSAVQGATGPWDDVGGVAQTTTPNDVEIGGTLTVGGTDVMAEIGILDADIIGLDGRVTTLEGDVVTLQANIDAEEPARIAADTTLQSNIDAEEAARIAADTTLQSNIDAEETRALAAEAGLQADINTEVAARTQLIRDAGPNADGNQIVRIGDNSLITEELDGTQRLRAEDVNGDSIAIRFDGDSGIIVDNSIRVAAPDEDPAFTMNASAGNQQLPSATPSADPARSVVVTVVGDAQGTQVQNASGGVLLDSNGNVTLTQAGGTEIGIELIRGVMFDVWNPGEPNEGEPVPGTERWVVGYEDRDGNFVQVGPDHASAAARDAWIQATPLDDAAYAGVPTRTETVLPGSGGNLQVGGNANIDGSLTVAGVNVLDDINAVRNEFAAADAVLDSKIDQEIADRTQLIRQDGVNADGNQIVRIGDNSLVTQELGGQQWLHGEDAFGNHIDLRLGGNADVIVNNDLYVGGDVFVNGRTQGLQEQVDANRAAIRSNKKDIQRNTRGIAMVAAMTHTTVLPGMENALDVSTAHFEGKTGLAISYSRRVNDHVQLNFGAATTTELDESVVRAGIGVQW